MYNYLIRPKKRTFTQSLEDDNNDHYKHIFDDYSSSQSPLSAKLDYSWIEQDQKTKKRKIQKSTPKKPKLKPCKNTPKIDRYFSYQNKQKQPLPNKPLQTPNQSNNDFQSENSNNHNHNKHIRSHNINVQNTETQHNNNGLWYQEYEPKNLTDIIGNGNVISIVQTFLNKWKQSMTNSEPNKDKQSSKRNLFGYYNETNVNRAQYMQRLNNNIKRSNSNQRKAVANSSKYPQIKCVCLYGKSGAGKTMIMHLLSQKLGFDAIGYNASQFTEVCAVTNNANLSWQYGMQTQNIFSLKPRLFVIEGADHIISENSKLKQILSIIKCTKIPIILIINSYQYSKGIAQLRKSKYCQWIALQRPKQEISQQMLSKLSLKFSSVGVELIQNLLNEFNGDMRSCLLMLQFWCDDFKHSISKYLENMKCNATPIDPCILSCIFSMKQRSFLENNKGKLWRYRHDECVNIFESNKRFFDAKLMHSLTTSAAMYESQKWYFNCPNLTPLFIFENYLLINNRDQCRDQSALYKLSKASESIADGDILSVSIQKNKNYKLMPIHSAVSCYNPARIMCKYFGGISFENNKGFIRFPQWFEQNTERERHRKYLDRISNNKRCKVSKYDNIMEYGPYLLELFLKSSSSEGMYHLLKRYGLMYREINDKQKWKVNSKNLHLLNKLSFGYYKQKNDRFQARFKEFKNEMKDM